MRSRLCPCSVNARSLNIRDGVSSPPHDGDEDEGAPKDSYHLVYVCMLMAGMGFLIPWTCYIGAIDYFFYYYKTSFPTVSVAIPLIYLFTTVSSSSVNVILVLKKISLGKRIIFGYVMFITSLSFIPLLDVAIHNCVIPTSVSFYLTMMSIGLVGIGSGVQQSSYYGLSSTLPRRYTQAVMAGESLAGVVESGFRIFTKISVQSERVGSLIFFSVTLGFIIVCVMCYCYIRRSKMVAYYTKRSSNNAPSNTGDKKSDTQLLISDNVELEEVSEGAITSSSESKDEDEGGDGVQKPNRETKTGAKQLRQAIPAFFGSFRRVVAQIWPLMGAIFITYFVTLLLFPGLLAEVQDCSLGSWTPVLLIALFNLIDFIAKWLALLYGKWSPKQLLVASIGRIILVPLILLCVVPSPTHPIIGGRYVLVWAGLFSLMLGLSNGYLGSLPLINASSQVKRSEDKELAGSTMTWILLMGLLLGAVCAYALTPLTSLEENQLCSNETMETFNLCHPHNQSVH